jgi:hypothetical protein
MQTAKMNNRRKTAGPDDRTPGRRRRGKGDWRLKHRAAFSVRGDNQGFFRAHRESRDGSLEVRATGAGKGRAMERRSGRENHRSWVNAGGMPMPGIGMEPSRSAASLRKFRGYERDTEGDTGSLRKFPAQMKIDDNVPDSGKEPPSSRQSSMGSGGLASKLPTMRKRTIAAVSSWGFPSSQAQGKTKGKQRED